MKRKKNGKPGLRLAIDVGNTETAVGLYSTDRSRGRATGTIRLPTDVDATPDLLESLLAIHLRGRRISEIVVSSVVPPLISTWVELAERNYSVRARVLDALSVPGIEIRIPRPEEAGIDRIVNAWMGHRRYKGPLVVVDMGTATTFDVVDAKGAYVGGIIAPGARLFPAALAQRTARLPHVALRRPKTAIGTTTRDALRSGAVYGHAAMVEGLLERVFAEMGSRRAVATGGLMDTVRPMLDQRFIAFDRSLTLDGIDAIARQMPRA